MSVVFGVDASTRAVSVAVLNDGAPSSLRVECRTVVIDAKGKLRGAERCLAHRRALDGFLADLTASGGPVDLIAVEQPVGAHVAPASLMCLGVLLASLADVVGCPVVELTPTMWKKAALGKGNASKADVMRWAWVAYGHDGDVQDEADALGVAVAGRMLLERDERGRSLLSSAGYPTEESA